MDLKVLFSRLRIPSASPFKSKFNHAEKKDMEPFWGVTFKYGQKMVSENGNFHS